MSEIAVSNSQQHHIYAFETTHPSGKLGECPPKAHASSSELAINPGEYDEGEYAGESPLRLYSYPGRDRLSKERLFGLGELCEYGLDPGLP